MQKQELRSNDNAVFRLFVHLVLVTKYRRKILLPPVLARCADILRQTAKAWQCSVVECQGEEDHVHVLLEVLPRVRPSDLVNNLKTVSSRRLRSEFPAVRNAYRGKAVLWSPSYCLLSAGGAPIDIIRRYIEGQGSGRA